MCIIFYFLSFSFILFTPDNCFLRLLKSYAIPLILRSKTFWPGAGPCPHATPLLSNPLRWGRIQQYSWSPFSVARRDTECSICRSPGAALFRNPGAALFRNPGQWWHQQYSTPWNWIESANGHGYWKKSCLLTIYHISIDLRLLLSALLTLQKSTSNRTLHFFSRRRIYA